MLTIKLSTAVHKLNAGKATIIDIRNPVKFNDGHIVGAKNIPMRRVSDMLVHNSNRGTLICLYTDNAEDATQFESYLSAMGYTNIRLIAEQ